MNRLKVARVRAIESPFCPFFPTTAFDPTLLVQLFGRTTDPEAFACVVYPALPTWGVEAADARIGCLRLFSPVNPTGEVLGSSCKGICTRHAMLHRQ
jgi:hypothetical protein